MLQFLIVTIFFMASVCMAADADITTFFDSTKSGVLMLKLGLDDAARLALENSHPLAAQRETAIAAYEGAGSARAKRFPQVSLGASTRFVSKIGEVKIPTGQTMDVGDHYNWSVGPVLNWVAWDGGAISKNARSLFHAASAEKLTELAVQRDALFSSRMAYFSVQLALEQLKLVAESLKLAKSQHADVAQRARIGSASRLDLVTAHQEVMERQRDFEDAQRELAMQLRNMFALFGIDQIQEPLFPVDVRLSKLFSSLSVSPDMYLSIDPISQSLDQMESKAFGETDIFQHPAFLSAKEKMHSAKLSYSAANAEHMPKINLEGKSTYEYPNFGQKERIWQNSLLLGLSVPIIDWGMISKQARSKRHEAVAAFEQMRDVKVNLERDLSQANDSVMLLKKSRQTCALSAKDASEVARLTYEEYKAGHVIFLEVQRANVKALESKVDLARIDSQLLAQFAKLESLKTKGSD